MKQPVLRIAGGPRNVRQAGTVGVAGETGLVRYLVSDPGLNTVAELPTAMMGNGLYCYSGTKARLEKRGSGVCCQITLCG